MRTTSALPCLSLLLLLLGAATAAADPTLRLVTAEPAVREVTLSGFTRARAGLRLVAETPGRIEEVLYDIGDRIEGDGTFARIDDTFIRLELEEIAVQQARLRTQIAFAQREVKRYGELARQNNASASQLDTLEQTLRDNTHELKVLEVKQRVLEERLARTRIRAPVGWRVTARSVEPGQWVKDGETVGEAADFSRLLVPIALTPEQHAALTAGADGLRLYLPDLDKEVPAAIYRTNPGFDPTTRKIAVDLEAVGEIEPRRGGLRAQLTLGLPERTGAVMLPKAAVQESYDEHWVTREDGTRVRVMVMGRTQGGQGERLRIAAPGLAAGERFRLPEGD
jgi:RND family efflux transporter MFP subunit